jgi:large subunit ribosomal protein L29
MKLKAKDLRLMGKDELAAKLNELRKEMIKHNAQIATGTTPKSPGQIRNTKKTIAKIMTLLCEKSKPAVKAEQAKLDTKNPEAMKAKLSEPQKKLGGKRNQPVSGTSS